MKKSVQRERMVILILVCCLVSLLIFLRNCSPREKETDSDEREADPITENSLSENDLRYATTDGDGAAYWSFQGPLNVFGGQYISGFMSSAMPCSARSILEFGSSGGEIVLNVAANRSDIQRYGVEISANARAYAAKHESLITVERTDELIAKKLRFDFVYTTSVLEHCSSPLDEIIKLRKVLSDEGLLMVFVINEGTLPDRDTYHKNIDGHLYTWRALMLGNLLDVGGLKICDCIEFHSAWPHVDLGVMQADRFGFCKAAEDNGKALGWGHVVCAATLRNASTTACDIGREGLARVAVCDWADVEKAEGLKCVDTSMY